LPSRLANRDGRKVLATLAAFVALGGLATSLSGCGASATLDPVARAADVSSEQTGIRFSLSISFSASALPTSGATITASGYVNERERSGAMTMNLSGVSALGGNSGALSGLEQMHVVFKYPEYYVGLPGLASKLPEGKTWMKLDLAQLAASHGVQLPQLSSIGQSDPSEFLRYLRASGGDVTKVGYEVINGVPTTHYRASISLTRIVDSYPESERTALRSALNALSSSGSLPVDVWIDHQNRVRRMQMSIHVSLPEGESTPSAALQAGNASATITIDFTSYGAVPPVSVPPASEVFDATALGNAGQSGVGGE